MAKHRRDATMPQSLEQIPNRRLRVRKDDCLRGTGAEQSLQRVHFGIACGCTAEQRAQLPDNTTIFLERLRTTGLDQQREKHELNIGFGGAREAPLEVARVECAALGGGTSGEIEICIMAQQSRAKCRQARTEPAQEHQAEQWCRSSAGSEPGDARNQLTKQRIRGRARSYGGATDAGKRNRR